MGVRFLHTSDWQLGMTRAFLPAESQARYTDDQFEAIRALARIAADKDCAFAVVAGDVSGQESGCERSAPKAELFRFRQVTPL